MITKEEFEHMLVLAAEHGVVLDVRGPWPIAIKGLRAKVVHSIEELGEFVAEGFTGWEKV